MTNDERKKLIDTYKDGYRAVSEALVGANDEELDARPAPNKWNTREIVHHLGDSEMAAAFRFRLLLALDKPQILGYDQDQFARRLHYERPTEASLQAFKAARAATAEIMDCMTDADWQREGTHTEHGPYTMDRWLQIYAAHAHKHAEQIKVARDVARKKT